MDFTNHTFMIVYNLLCLIQLLSYSLFYHYFLISKYGKKSMVIMTLSLFMIHTIIFSSGLELMPLKTIIYISNLYLSAFFLYNGPFIKRIVAAPLLFATTAFLDFIFQFIIIFVFQYSNILVIPTHIIIFILIIETTFMCILNTLILLYLNSSFISSKKSFRLFIVLTFDVLFTTIILSQSLIFNGIMSISNQVQTTLLIYIVIIICMIGSFFSTIYIFKSMRLLKQNISQEILMQTISNEYLNQLDEYLNMRKNDEIMRHLRHDIMNYVQIVQTYRRRDDNK